MVINVRDVPLYSLFSCICFCISPCTYNCISPCTYNCISPYAYICISFLYLIFTSLTANAPVATVLGSIPASVGTVESEGRQMKQC